MSIECVAGFKSLYVEYEGSIDTLKSIYPDLKIVRAQKELDSPQGTGVFIFEDNGSYSVRIFGGCPNYVNGECKLKDECITFYD